MFARWNFAKLRAAERALADGRLDEAFERLVAADLHTEKRAARVVDGLARGLLARARLEAQAGRYREALADLDRLATIDRVDEDARTLRDRTERELGHRAKRHAAEAEAYDEAAADLDAGRLESGRLAVDRIEDSGRREQLREQLDIRVQRQAQLLRQAEEALARGDVLAGCRFWAEAVSRQGRTSESDALTGRLAGALQDRITQWLREGRLDRVRLALHETAALSELAPTLREFETVTDLLDRAAGQLTASDFAALRTTLTRLGASIGPADWLKAADAALERILDGRSALFASPLGTLQSQPGTPPQAVRPGMAETQASARPAPLPTNIARAGVDPLLMLIDGTGSSLLIAGDVVKIGRAGGLHGIDVPIPADIHSHHADIMRIGEDYFLDAHGPVEVNRQPQRRVLLRHGDRIELGSGAKLTFHKPSAKSDTAVLLLSSRARLPMDVSQVILFRETCLLGPQASCHVRTREGDTRLVLFERDGGLHVRRAARDGRPSGPAEAVPLNETRDYGDLRMTVKDYAPGQAGRVR